MSPVEKLICNNRQLSDMDEYMGELYVQLRRVDPKNAALTKQQIAWMKTRDRECPPERPVNRPAFACVAKRLEIRIEQLQARLQTLGESDMEGPEENDTGPGVRAASASPPQPKPKPVAKVAEAPMPEPAMPNPTEGKEPQVANLAPSKPEPPQQQQPTVKEEAVPETTPPAPAIDAVDEAAKDAYRHYILLRGCEKAGAVQSADPVKPGLKKMDDALRETGKDPDKLWKLANEEKSTDGTFNTLLFTYSMMMQIYPFAQQKDKMDVENFCQRLSQLVDLSTMDTISKIDPSKIDRGPDISIKDF